jgi:TolB-like protein
LFHEIGTGFACHSLTALSSRAKENYTMNARRIRTFTVLACAMVCASAAEHTLLAQGQARRTRIAVVRFKSSQETPERKYIVNDLSSNLAASLRENSRYGIPDDAIVEKAIDGEGLRRNGLLKMEKCFDVGKALNADYVVAGSALLHGIKWHASVRVLSVQQKTLVTTEDVEYSVDEMKLMYSVLASRILAALDFPPKADSNHTSFTWKGEYLLSFGKHRIDMEPPILLAINTDPPFELSVVAEMALAGGTHAVTNFEVFVDDLGLGSIHGGLTPPVPIRDREKVIGGHTYLFSLALKEMRVFTVSVDNEEAKYVTSALFSVTATQRK